MHDLLYWVESTIRLERQCEQQGGFTTASTTARGRSDELRQHGRNGSHRRHARASPKTINVADRARSGRERNRESHAHVRRRSSCRAAGPNAAASPLQSRGGSGNNLHDHDLRDEGGGGSHLSGTPPSRHYRSESPSASSISGWRRNLTRKVTDQANADTGRSTPGLLR